MTIIITAIVAGAAGLAAGYRYRDSREHSKLNRRMGNTRRRCTRTAAGQYAKIKDNDWLRESV